MSYFGERLDMGREDTRSQSRARERVRELDEGRRMFYEDPHHPSYSQSVYEYYPAAYFQRDNYNNRFAHDPYWSHVPSVRQQLYVPDSRWIVTNSEPGGYDVIRHPPGRERSNARWNRFYSSSSHEWYVNNRARSRMFNNDLYAQYTRHFNARQADVERRQRKNYSTKSRGIKRRRDEY